MYNVVGRLSLDFQLERGVGVGGGSERRTERDRDRQRQAERDRQTDRDTERVQTNTQRPKASVKESYRQIIATFNQLFSPTTTKSGCFGRMRKSVETETRNRVFVTPSPLTTPVETEGMALIHKSTMGI